MRPNEYVVAKIGVDTAENEPFEVSPKGGVLNGSFRCHVPLLQPLVPASLLQELGKVLETGELSDVALVAVPESLHL